MKIIETIKINSIESLLTSKLVKIVGVDFVKNIYIYI